MYVWQATHEAKVLEKWLKWIFVKRYNCFHIYIPVKKQDWAERSSFCSSASTQDEDCLRGDNVQNFKRINFQWKKDDLSEAAEWLLSVSQIASFCECFQRTGTEIYCSFAVRWKCEGFVSSSLCVDSLDGLKANLRSTNLARKVYYILDFWNYLPLPFFLLILR